MYQVTAFIVTSAVYLPHRHKCKGTTMFMILFSDIWHSHRKPGACLSVRGATFMTQSQAAKGNIIVTNSKGMNMIKSEDFKLKASVDLLSVVPCE